MNRLIFIIIVSFISSIVIAANCPPASQSIVSCCLGNKGNCPKKPNWCINPIVGEIYQPNTQDNPFVAKKCDGTTATFCNTNGNINDPCIPGNSCSLASIGC